jgi:hypothetical protein
VEFVYESVSGGYADEPPADSIIALLDEHRKRYVYETSAGTIVLRHMPLRMKRLIDNIIDVMYPGIPGMLAEHRAYLQGLIGLTEEQMPADAAEKVKKAEALIAPSQGWKACGVIVHPTINSLDDYNSLYAMLTEQEQPVLQELVNLLSVPADPDSYDDTAFNIAERHGVRMVDKEIIENLTVSQAQFFAKRIERENLDIERRMKG